MAAHGRPHSNCLPDGLWHRNAIYYTDSRADAHTDRDLSYGVPAGGSEAIAYCDNGTYANGYAGTHAISHANNCAQCAP